MDKKLQELGGMTVIGSGGKVVGKVLGVEVDPHTWHVGRLRVKVRSADVKEALGLEVHFWKQALLLVDTKHVQAVGDVVCLSASLEELGAIMRDAIPVEEEPPGETAEKPASA